MLLRVNALCGLALAAITGPSLAEPTTPPVDVFTPVSPTPSAVFAPATPASTFLPAEQAFRVEVTPNRKRLEAHFTSAPEYYLYQSKFKVSGSELQAGALRFSPKPTIEQDPEFGSVPIFDQGVTLTAAIKGSGPLTITYQGCARAGLCYPPQTYTMDWQSTATPPLTPQSAPTLAPVTASSAKGDLATADLVNSRSGTRAPVAAAPASAVTPLTLPLATATFLESTRPARDSKAVVMPTPKPPVNPQRPPETAPASTSQPLAQSLPVFTPESIPHGARPSDRQAILATDSSHVPPPDPFGLKTHFGLGLLLLLLAGLGLAFTPCVLPMYPIVADMVARQHRRSAAHGFALSGAYGVGVASSYGLLGVLVAAFGQQVNLMAWMQQPWVLGGTALLFVLLALASFGVVPLQLPVRLTTWLDRASQSGQQGPMTGRLVGAGLTGFFAALVVSPCVTAPLAGVLLSVSTLDQPLLGGAALFALGLGMSVPLMAMGGTEGRWLPRSGRGLEWVKQGFGWLLLAVALVLAGRIWESPALLVGWALWLSAVALWLWQGLGRAQPLLRPAALVTLGLALTQVLGAVSGQTDPLDPLPSLRQSPVLAAAAPVIYTSAQLQQAVHQSPLTLVEVTADWCVSCRAIERTLFKHPPAALAEALQPVQRVKLDVTRTTAESQAVLKQLDLFGPPALILFKDGDEVARLQGEPSAEQLAALVRRAPV